MENSDDGRIVTTTVAKLKAFEAAVRDRQTAKVAVMRAKDAFDAATLAFERAKEVESDAIDAELRATQELHQTPGS